jgi:hypothetical protein
VDVSKDLKTKSVEKRTHKGVDPYVSENRTLNTYYLAVWKQKSIEFLCNKWLNMNEGLVCMKMINCTDKKHRRNAGKH